MLLSFLLVLLVLICIALTTVILLQRSEGGALGMGGSPAGLLTARGAGDLLTRTTAILAAAFFVLCLLLTVLSGRSRTGESVVDRLKVDALNPDALNHSMRSAPSSSLAVPAAVVGRQPAPTSTSGGFEAPRPEVHTSPAARTTGLPPAVAADTGDHAPVSHMLGYQTAPSAAPTLGSPPSTRTPGP